MKQSCSFQNLHVIKQFYSFSYLYVLVLTNQKTFSVRSHVRSHGRYHVKSHERSHGRYHVQSHERSHGRYHVKSHERSHGRYHVKSHERSHGRFYGRSHGRFYNNTQSLKMEHIGTPAETEDVLSPTIIPLFGILSPPAEQEEECHFCLETITKGQFMVFKLPCCGHLAQTECLKTWASASQKESIVRCAYCRTTYPYEDTRFLCLQEYTEKLNCRMCCHTKVHTECTSDLTVLLSLLTYDHTLKCGQLTECNSLCVGV